MYTQKIEIAAVGSTGFEDITPYLAPQGFTWKRIDVTVSGPTTQDGKTRKARIRQKIGAALTFREQLDTEAQDALSLLKDELVQLRFYSPETGTQETHTVRTGNVSVRHYTQKGSNAILQGYSMDLEED